jgi:hypothetical protein
VEEQEMREEFMDGWSLREWMGGWEGGEGARKGRDEEMEG